jgi:hypothetical protein
MKTGEHKRKKVVRKKRKTGRKLRKVEVKD